MGRDLIVGTGGQSAIVTLVERSTRYVMLGHLPGGHTTAQVRDVLVPLIATLPGHLRGSLTWDQGCEMAAHKHLSIHNAADLEHVAQQLNARPRKTLDWKTPAERLHDLLTAT